MTDLVIPLKGEYFDAIASGEKGEEFRLVNDYWTRRLRNPDGSDRTFDRIVLTKGYPKRDDHARRLVRAFYEVRVIWITHPHFGAKPVMVYAINVDRKLGEQEGEVCRRSGCEGVIAFEPSSDREGCSCFRSAPCGYCMSIVPTCPSCGWRAEETN